VDDDDGATSGEALVSVSVGDVNDPPNTPINPNPENDETNVNLNPELSVYVSDPDSNVLNVSFFNKNNILIGFENNVENGSNASIIWSGLSYSKTYYWYAVVNDSELENTSEIWNFKTKSNPGGGQSGNVVPVADASAGVPYIGVVGEEITFNGSRRSDPDGDIISWHWDFGDGSENTGEVTTHIYSSNGTYNATLTVTDNDGAKDEDTFYVIISTGNHPPQNLDIDGPLTGKKNHDYKYSISAIDIDTDDMLRYIINWGDGTTYTSDIVASGFTITTSHNWSTWGAYDVTVTAEDNYSASISKTFTVLIDVIVIDGEIVGYIIDEDSSDPFDIFNNTQNKKVTKVEKDSTGAYLIDSDGNGKWDFAYDPEHGLLKYPEYVYKKYFNIYQLQNTTPGFELISIIAMIALVTIIMKRRQKK
jgi:PKD repeat protein